MVGIIPVLADDGADHKVRQARPILLGTSGGNVIDRTSRFCCSGTLGGLVEDASGTQYILSNNHVLGVINTATAGDDVNQPGMIDNGCAAPAEDIVADFSEYITIDFNSTNLVDAAIAEVRAGQVDSIGTIIDIGAPSTSTVSAFVGMDVQKSGRTSGYTNGIVDAVDVTVNIGYPNECGSRRTTSVTFVNQITITPGEFSTGGDSGSIIFDMTANGPQATALLFAGSTSRTIANHISDALNANWAVGALTMAGGTAAVCGDGTCDANEDSCNCAADCGAAPGSETSCNDGVDNDCDGATDCDDSDCLGDAACPSCGDGACDAGEDSCNCASDCGVAPSTETSCSDGSDNDCDGAIDCLDSDCTGDAACQSGSSAIVDCITYDANVTISIAIVDDINNSVSGASVTAEVFVNGSSVGTATGTTDSSGSVGFRLRGASNGDCITTDVLSVVASGLSFDGSEPVNGYQKKVDDKPDADCRASSDVCGTSNADFVGKGRNPSAAITLEAIAVPGHGKSRVQVSAIKLRSSNALLAIPGVVGHGVGKDADGNYVIQVYLDEDSAAARARVPALLEGVSVKIIVTGPFEAH